MTNYSLKKLKNRMQTVFALMLALAIASSFITITSFAQAKITTYADVSVNPKISGLGQTILVNAWTSPPPPSKDPPVMTPSGMKECVPRTGYTIVFTKPNGTTYTYVHEASCYADGTIYLAYAPDQIGTWTVKLSWAGDNLYAGSESQPFTFTVQQTAPAGWPEGSLPTEYWTRPINAENREWAQYLGNWLQNQYDAANSNFQPYCKAPITPHVLWTKQYAFGGLAGGEFGTGTLTTFATTISPIYAFGGLAYYKYPYRQGAQRPEYVPDTYCIDLYTGETIWNKPIPTWATPSAENQLYVGPIDMQSSGVGAYIYTAKNGKVDRYHPATGALLGTQEDPDAGISKFHEGYFYYYKAASGTLIKWDPKVYPTPFNNSIVWKVQTPYNPSLYWEDIGLCFPTNALAAKTAAINLTTGEVMWEITRDTIHLRSSPTLGYGKYFNGGIDKCWHAFDLYTGTEVWVSEPMEGPFGSFQSYASACAYGKFYGECYNGYLYAIDAETGEIAWKFYSGDTGSETPYGTYPFWGNPAIADGKIYVATGEHTPSSPRWRGGRLFCLDANTGKEIWSIAFQQGQMNTRLIADSMLLSQNDYDGALYCFGKGPTATEVTVSQNPIANKASTVIMGTVTDQSPGQKDAPCVSKESMSAWMEYLHMQKQMPTNATGVPVALRAVGSDGTVVEIANVTTDLKGHFSYMWTPQKQDLYTVTATFNGDDSYWSSSGETTLGVTAAPSASPSTSASVPPASPTPSSSGSPSASSSTSESPTQAPPPTQSPSIEIYIAAAAVAIIIVVVVVALILRRRK